MPETAQQTRPLIDRVIIPSAQAISLVAGLAIVLPAETNRLFDAGKSPAGVFSWLFNWNIDTTPWQFVFLLLPFAWLWRTSKQTDVRRLFRLTTTPAKFEVGPGRSKRTVVMLAIVVGITSFAMHRSIGRTNVSGDDTAVVRLQDLPPAYHDEYSYLFQSRTMQQGRFSFPSSEFMPEMFDQMHVLNEGKMASRYFPGVGAWMAPWDALGMPIMGHWIAGALAAVCVFLAGREIGGNATGMVAGLLFAVSPGIGLFGNLLLAHHPTLFALCLFLFAYLRFRRDESKWWAMLAGTSLVFAMLCRPMTAAGFGLPFGIHLLWLGFGRVVHTKSAKPLAGVCWMGLPIVLGFVVLFVSNKAITGEALTTPYQVYTDVYTPRHVYGFNNVVRGEQHLGPKVIENYDTWAKNLDWPLAANNVFNRMVASLQWTLALVPLTMALVAGVLLFPFIKNGFRLIMLAFISLHVAHIPYWFDGIMHWHYVFETAPLLCLICAVVLVRFAMWWKSTGHGRMVLWGLLVVAVSLLPTFTSFESLWTVARLDAGISEVAFSKKRYAAFNSMIDALVQQGPSERKYLVLIIPDKNDRHIDYVLNNPGLTDRVIFGRADADLLGGAANNQLTEILDHYPDRECVLFSAATNRLIPIGN